MSTDTTALTVEILGNADSAVQAINISQESLDALNAAVAPLTGAIEKLTTVIEGNVSSLGNLSAAHERASATSDSLTSHSLLLARGLVSIDAAAAGAAVRAAGMADVLDRMAGATPGLLALGAVLTGIFAGFAFFKEGIKEATDFQSAMRELTIAAEASGQSTAGMTEKVSAWSDAMAEAAGISESQTIPALLRLVDAGQSWQGAMAETTIAGQMVAAGMGAVRGSTDLAASSGQRFAMVMRALTAMQDGNYASIAVLDPAIRKLVEAHKSNVVIMEAINEQTKRAIEANNTNAASWDHVRGILEVVAKDIATGVLPAMMRLGNYVYGFVAACEAAGKAFSNLGRDIVSVVGGSVDAIGQLASAIAQVVGGLARSALAAHDATTGNIVGAIGNIKAAQQDFGEADKWRDKLVGNFHRIGAAAMDVGKQKTEIEHTFNNALERGNSLMERQLALLHQTAANTSAINQAAYKPTKGSHGGGTGYNAPASSYQEDAVQRTVSETTVTRELSATTDALTAAKNRASTIENELANNVKLATTMQAQAAAQQAFDAQRVKDTAEQTRILSVSIGTESQEQSRLTAEHKAAAAEYESLNRRLDEHVHGLEGAKKESILTKEEATKLAAAVADAKARYDDTGRALNSVTNSLKTHRDELVATANASRDASLKDQEDLAATARKWDDFQHKQIEDQNQARAIMGMNAAQLVAYYRSEYEQDYANYVFYQQQKDKANAAIWEANTEAIEQKLNQELNTLYQQNYNNYKNWLNKAESGVDSFVLDVLTKHKSMRDYLKQIYDDILKAFISMVTKMIMESSVLQSVLQKVFGFLGGGSAAGGVGGAAISGLGGGTGIASGMGGASGAGGSSGGGIAGPSTAIGRAAGGVGGMSPATAAATAPAALAALAGSNANAASTPWSLSGLGGGTGPSGAGGISSVAPAGSTLLSGAGGLKIGGVGLGTLAMGAALGGLVSNLLDHGNQDASIGGMLGGAGGTLLGGLLGHLLFTGGMALGPAGAIVGAILGSLIGTELGGLFGDHFPKANEPDIYQTQQWGQELADLQGSTGGNPMIANGQNFVMDSWSSSNTQGKGWNVLIEDFVAKFRNNQKALPQELQSGFPELEKLWGGATNHPDFNSNGKNGMLQIGSGEMAEWTTYWQYVSAYGPAIAQLMNMYQPTDMYAASLNGSVSQLGGYTPSGDPWLLHQFPDAALPSGVGAMAPQVMSTPGGSKQTVVNINTYQTFGGSMIAQESVDNRILEAVRKIPGFTQADLNY